MSEGLSVVIYVSVMDYVSVYCSIRKPKKDSTSMCVYWKNVCFLTCMRDVGFSVPLVGYMAEKRYSTCVWKVWMEKDHGRGVYTQANLGHTAPHSETPKFP